MTENWKVIEVFESYAVSDFGRIRRIVIGTPKEELLGPNRNKPEAET